MPLLLEETTTAIPTPEELLLDIPQTKRQFDFVLEARKTVQNILSGQDTRLLLIVGPCSVHDPKGLLDYAEQFKELSMRVKERFFLILRTYFEKPRTTIGWKGYLLDPHLDGSYAVSKGLRSVRQLLSTLTDMEIAVGSELLEMLTFPYYSDFLSWGCIGARTSSSPPHRQLAATLPFPIGFKNSVDGSLDSAIQGVISANSPHLYLGIGMAGQMARLYGEGNGFAHVVLRGSEHRPNYYPKDIAEASQKCYRHGLCQKVIIDCSHDNCFKKHEEQAPVFQSVIDQAKSTPAIAGAMLESYLFSGNQPLQEKLRYGVSITDPCIDWETTKKLILESA